jgi:hypothetical protein
MDQETFNKMLKTALQEKLTFALEQIPDVYGINPDQYTITFLFDGDPVAELVLNPLC